MTEKFADTILDQFRDLKQTLNVSDNPQCSQFASQLESLSQTARQQGLLLETVTAISDAASSILDLRPLLDFASNLIKDNMGFEQVECYLLDRAQQRLDLFASTDSLEESYIQLESAAESAPVQAFQKHQPHVNISNNTAVAAMPLISRGRVTGVLNLYSAQPDHFSSANLRLLQTLSDQLANTIQNTTLFTAADQQLEQLITLNNTNLQIGSAVRLDEILKKVVDLSTKLVNGSASIVRLFNPSEQQFQVQAAHNPPKGMAVKQIEPLGSTLSSHVLTGQQSVLANNWPNSPLAEQYPYPAANETPSLSILNVPISAKNEVIGTVEVHHFKDAYAFDENDLHLLSLLAAQTAVAIEKSQHLNRAEHNRRFLKTVIEHIPDPIFIKDRHHTWIEMNQANADVIGHSEEDLIGHTDSDYFTEELTEEFYRRDEEVFKENRIFEFEDKTVWGDGKEHIAYTRLIPIPDNAGNPQYVLGITNDITGQKAHETERERFLAETAALYNGSKEIASSLSERQILDALLEQIRLQDPCEITIYRLSNVQGEPIWAEVRAAWQKMETPTYPAGTRVYLPESAQGRLLTTEEAIFVENIATDSYLSTPERDSFEPTGAVSTAILPINFIGQKIGVVIVHFTQPAKFNAVTRRFWLSMVGQAGMALNNRQLIQEAAYRAIQMETAAEVARAASSLLGLNELLNSAVALIKDRFELYYAGAFLLDESQKWAMLRAGTGPAGQALLEEKYRLRVANSDTLITWSIRNRRPGLLLDVGQDAVQFENPHLPETRSEMALPLIYRNQAIGALSIQSNEPAAFSREDIIFLQTMADQLANAIENARLFEQAQQELTERKRAEQMLLLRERYLAAQLEIQNLLLASKSHQAPYDQILALLGPVSGASRVYVFENSRDENNVLLTSQKAEWCGPGITPKIDNPDLQNLPFKEALPRWAETLSTGKTIRGRVADFPQKERDILEPQDIKAILVLPITVGGELFGMIGFDNCESDSPWAQSEAGLLSTAAAAISLWHERKYAEESLLMALQRTESLYRIGNVMATSSHQQTTFEAVLAEYLRLLDVSPVFGSIILFEHAKGYSKVQAMVIDGYAVESTLSFPASQDSVATHLIEHKKPLVVEDVFSHPLTKTGPEFWQQDASVTTLLFTPLTVQTKVVGAVVAGAAQKNFEFSTNNIELGQAITDQLAIWLENRQLLAETRYRSERLQTTAEIARAASSILDVDELINASVNLIRNHFDFYYVGMFLLDDSREWAVLRAGTGKAGRIQLSRNHRLKVGGESMIGWSVAHRKARIALDVGEEAVHFRNPILPDTHSEMALPLVSREEVLGALTVQSTERGAFTDEDITLLQTMADQLANAIANAHLFENVAQAQQQAEQRLHQTQVLQQLSQRLAATLHTNEILDIFFTTCITEVNFDYIQLAQVDRYQHKVIVVGGTGVSETVLQQPDQPLESHGILADIVRTGKTEIIAGWDDRLDRDLFDSENQEDWVRLFTPMQLRQENIGVIEAGYNQGLKSNIADQQIGLLQAFISQTALALDNAQRYEASQRAARREALIKEITTKVRSSTNLDTILQTTVEEVGRAIANKRAYIHLNPPKIAEMANHPVTVETKNERGRGATDE